MEQSEELSRIRFTFRTPQVAAYHWAIAQLTEGGKLMALTSGRDRPDAPYKRLTAERTGGMD